MAVRSKKLAAGTSAPVNTEVTIFTVPAGRTAILKDVHLNIDSGSVTRAVVLVVSGARRAGLIDSPLSGTDVVAATVWIVLEPGDQIRLFSQGGTFTAWCSGTLLEGVPT